MGNMYENICALCEAKGIKPGAMCREIGMSRSVLTEMKSGRTKTLSVKSSKLIADYFGVSVESLMDQGEKEKPLVNGDEELTEYLEELKNRPECRMLFKVTKGCTKEELEQAVKIIEALRK